MLHLTVSLSAMRGVKKYPKLRDYLQRQGRRGVRDSALAKRLHKAFRDGQVPHNFTNPRNVQVVQHVVLARTNLNNLYDAAILEMDHQLDTYMGNESAILNLCMGWTSPCHNTLL